MEPRIVTDRCAWAFF